MKLQPTLDSKGNLSDLSCSDLSVRFGFDCDSFVDNKVLYDVKNFAHKDKFNGEEMLKPDYDAGCGSLNIARIANAVQCHS